MQSELYSNLRLPLCEYINPTQPSACQADSQTPTLFVYRHSVLSPRTNALQHQVFRVVPVFSKCTSLCRLFIDQGKGRKQVSSVYHSTFLMRMLASSSRLSPSKNTTLSFTTNMLVSSFYDQPDRTACVQASTKSAFRADMPQG